MSGPRLTGLAFVGILFIVGLTWVMELFISHNGKSWIPAIQASSTVTLVLVTAVYVLLTGRMVRVQESQVRTAAQEATMRELVVLLTNTVTDYGTIYDIPVDFATWPNEQIQPFAESLGDLGTELAAKSPLLPKKLYSPGMRAASKALTASTTLRRMYTVCLGQRIENLETGKEWSVDDLRARWQREMADATSDPSEWDTLMSGAFLLDASTALQEFLKTLTKTLQEEQN
jgi:hypothetical protein